MGIGYNPSMAKASSTNSRQGKPKKTRTPTVRDFGSAVRYLDSLINYEVQPRFEYTSHNFSLARMSRLLRALGNPHKRVKTIHVAGTKGKGSTCAMLGAMLSNCDMSVGVYSSPHLLCVRERIQVDGQVISESDFARCIAAVVTAAAKPRVGTPSYFEAITAAGLLHYERAGVDLAVIETGLGGRLDATNAISPEVVGITSISYDHEAQLGKTLPEIAREKAGIMKAGVPAISAPQPSEVKEVLREVAQEVGASLKFTGEELTFTTRFEASRGIGRHTRLCLTTPTSRFEHLHVPLLGAHQAINCALALAMVDALKSRGFEIDDQQVTDGLALVKIAGRMEIISEDPKILVDVAHNAASIDALMRGIGQNIIADSMVVIFGCQKHKDIPGMVRGIQLGADKIIFTRTDSPRSADPLDLAAEYMEQCGRVAQVTQSLDEAMGIADRAVTREDLICITGSFYLIAEATRKYSREAMMV